MVKLGILSTVGAVYSVPSLFTDEEVAGTAYTIEEDVMTYIDTYRKLFSKANDRPGMMGDRNQVYLKLCRWLHINPGYTMQDIITKTREYIARKQEIGEQIYLQQADYLVYKITNGEEKSMLSAIIDEDFALVTFDKQI
jgi:hypothetical protein